MVFDQFTRDIMMHKTEKNLISKSELIVLRCLRERKSVSRESGIAEISEISVTTGIRDSDEVLRALYTLEGKSLVEPQPRGDFTSNQWQITEVGVKALDLIQTTVVAM